jgi:hypothetical protein
MKYDQFAICTGCGEEYEKVVMAQDYQAWYCDTCQHDRDYIAIKTQWQASRGSRLILEADGLTIQSPVIDMTEPKTVALWRRTLEDEYRRLQESTTDHIYHHLIKLSDTLYACPGGM